MASIKESSRSSFSDHISASTSWEVTIIKTELWAVSCVIFSVRVLGNFLQYFVAEKMRSFVCKIIKDKVVVLTSGRTTLADKIWSFEHNFLLKSWDVFISHIFHRLITGVFTLKNVSPWRAFSLKWKQIAPKCWLTNDDVKCSPSCNGWVAGPGHGGDCEAAGLDLRQHAGRPGRVRREGEVRGRECSGSNQTIFREFHHLFSWRKSQEFVSPCPWR